MEKDEKNHFHSPSTNFRMIYLDTNTFFYALDRKSPNYKVCRRFLDNSIKRGIPITTSTETIQEVIHYYRSIGRDKIGLVTCKYLLKIIPEPLIITNEVIEQFLKFVPRYKKPESRNLLHLAACVVYNILSVVTYDADFKKFSEIKAYLPHEFKSS